MLSLRDLSDLEPTEPDELCVAQTLPAPKILRAMSAIHIISGAQWSFTHGTPPEAPSEYMGDLYVSMVVSGYNHANYLIHQFRESSKLWRVFDDDHIIAAHKWSNTAHALWMHWVLIHHSRIKDFQSNLLL